MPYLELIIKVNQPAVELVADFLTSELGFSGIITDEDYLHMESLSGVVKAYAAAEEVIFSEEIITEKLSEKRIFLQSCGFSEDDLGDWSFSFKKVEDDSWADKWKDYWTVQKIGEKTIICPSWLEYESNENEIKIELDPGSAFGTGTHPTTRLCIKELEKYVRSSTTVADVGCGSGILSIVAKKLNAQEVAGVDIDADSVRVSEENAQINSVDCSFSEGTIQDIKKEYDVVVANILANVIVDIMPELKRITKGVMILSGIIEEKAQDVLDSMQKNDVKVVSQAIEAGNGENWVCIVGEN